jgi:hypothetical protein
MLVIEGIPYIQCPHCGERYFTAQTLQEVENIKAHRNDRSHKRRLPVAVFPSKVA